MKGFQLDRLPFYYFLDFIEIYMSMYGHVWPNKCNTVSLKNCGSEDCLGFILSFWLPPGLEKYLTKKHFQLGKGDIGSAIIDLPGAGTLSLFFLSPRSYWRKLFLSRLYFPEL